MSVEGFNDIIQGPLATYLKLSEQIGGDVAAHAKLVSQAFQAQLQYLIYVSQCKETSQTRKKELLKSTSTHIEAVQEYREKHKDSAHFLHFSAVSESIAALGWATVAPAPAVYVKEKKDTFQLYSVRLLQEWKKKDKTHVEWVKAWGKTLTELQQFVEQHHSAGLVWGGGKASSAAPTPPYGLPPLLPVCDVDFSLDSSAQESSALFSEINEGKLPSPLARTGWLPVEVLPAASSDAEGRRLLRSVAALAAGVLLHFTAYTGALGLQSTIHGAQELGTRALVTQCAVLVLTCALLPSVCIRYLGCKWTVVSSMLMYLPYVCAQLWPRAETLLPAAALMGLGSGLFWSAQSIYLSRAGRQWAKLTERTPEQAITLFFAIICTTYSLSYVSGNVISLIILNADGIESELGVSCGFDFCPEDRGVETNANLRPPPQHQLVTLFVVLAVCMACGALLVAFILQPLKTTEEQLADTESGLWLVTSALRQHADPLQLMVLPLTAFTGVSQAFLAADFTEAFVSCSWGVSRVGAVLSCYGAASCLSSAVVGWRARHLGRAKLLAAYGALYGVVLVALSLWWPDPDHTFTLYIMATMWGLADFGVPVINASYGVLFVGREQAAYSCLRLWETLGFIYSYSASPLLCMRAKLVVLGSLLAVGICGYGGAEWLVRRRRPRRLTIQTEQPATEVTCG